MKLKKSLWFIVCYFLDRIYLTFAYNFAPFMIIHSMSKRTGQCKQCGYCCGNCFYLQEGKCIVYQDRPMFCQKDFPVNRFELKYHASKDCGYSFKK